MTMTRKQLKALRRHKAIVRRHNIKTNNKPKTKPFLTLLYNPNRGNRTYRLYNI